MESTEALPVNSPEIAFLPPLKRKKLGMQHKLMMATATMTAIVPFETVLLVEDDVVSVTGGL